MAKAEIQAGEGDGAVVGFAIMVQVHQPIETFTPPAMLLVRWLPFASIRQPPRY